MSSMRALATMKSCSRTSDTVSLCGKAISAAASPRKKETGNARRNFEELGTESFEVAIGKIQYRRADRSLAAFERVQRQSEPRSHRIFHEARFGPVRRVERDFAPFVPVA